MKFALVSSGFGNVFDIYIYIFTHVSQIRVGSMRQRETPDLETTHFFDCCRSDIL